MTGEQSITSAPYSVPDGVGETAFAVDRTLIPAIELGAMPAAGKTIHPDRINWSRCNFGEMIREQVGQCGNGTKVAVLGQCYKSSISRPLTSQVCGPRSLSHDVSNAVARIEMDIVRNKLPVAEVWMHREQFDW